jgi:hypothetical protein
MRILNATESPWLGVAILHGLAARHRASWEPPANAVPNAVRSSISAFYGQECLTGHCATQKGVPLADGQSQRQARRVLGMAKEDEISVLHPLQAVAVGAEAALAPSARLLLRQHDPLMSRWLALAGALKGRLPSILPILSANVRLQTSRKGPAADCRAALSCQLAKAGHCRVFVRPRMTSWETCAPIR